jgi:geranylgeranyl diphosphate synthase type II
MDFAAELQRRSNRIDQAIDRLVPIAETRPERIHAAMRYSLLAGGKRLRPVLLVAAAELFDPGERIDPLPASVSVECIHTYSLIHDDLPCMDNDDLRRGRPTAHKAFDEATALLAGDALLTYAFELLGLNYPPEIGLGLVRELAIAAGSRCLIGGQMEDLLAEKSGDSDPARLEYIHLHKTAAMIEVSLAMGGQIGKAGASETSGLLRAGRHLGLAFQIMDDVLDATADTATLGKTAGKDERAEKMTYVRLHGLDSARRMATEQSEAAIAEFRKLPGGAPFLAALAESLARRKA